MSLASTSSTASVTLPSEFIDVDTARCRTGASHLGKQRRASLRFIEQKTTPFVVHCPSSHRLDYQTRTSASPAARRVSMGRIEVEACLRVNMRMSISEVRHARLEPTFLLLENVQGLHG